LTPPLLLAAALFFLAEGLLWRLAGVYAWLGRLPVFRTLEARIRTLPPYAALALFGTPAVALAPVKFLALYWLAGGHPTWGITTIAAAKIAGTALVARIYQLTRATLITLPWFAWCETQLLNAKKAAYAWWRSTFIGRLAREQWRAVRERFRAWRLRRRTWLARRWAAIRKRFNPAPPATASPDKRP